MLDCVVVGGGFSGLRAATALHEAGASVRVFEARDRVGGRTMAGELAGHTIDLGGMWLGPTQERLCALADAHGLRRYAQPLAGRALFRVDGREARPEGDAIENAVAPLARLDLLRLDRALRKLSRTLPVDRPWTAPEGRRLDALSVAAFAERQVRTRAVRELLRFVCRSVFCAEPEELSLLFFLWYLKCGDGLDVLLGMQGDGAQAMLFHGGVHQLAVALADALGDRVALEAPVRAVTQEDRRVVVRTDASEVEARFVIVATPPGLTQRMHFAPRLPRPKRELLARQRMGACIKVWIAYARPFWRERGLNGLLMDEDQPFGPVFDATPPGSEVALLAGFFDGAPAAEWTERSPEDREAAVRAALVALLGPDASNPLGVVEKDWCADPWSEGCYGATMAPGTLTAYGPALRTPVGRVHWAGTETATRFTGYIEGALEAGERAASEVLARRRAE